MSPTCRYLPISAFWYDCSCSSRDASLLVATTATRYSYWYLQVAAVETGLAGESGMLLASH